MLKIEVGDAINTYQQGGTTLVICTSEASPFSSGVPKIIKTLYPSVYQDYKDEFKRYVVGQSFMGYGENIITCLTSEEKGSIDYDNLITSMQEVAIYARATRSVLVIVMPENGDEKRIKAILEAVFYRVDATLYLKE